MLTIPKLCMMFNRFNAKYFDGKLPIIKIKISNAKALGTTVSIRDFDGFIPKEIRISKKYDWTEKRLERTMLQDLWDGNIKPSRVVGGGYRNGKSVAGGWLIGQILFKNEKDGWKKGVTVASSGKPFTTLARAKNSKHYKSAIKVLGTGDTSLYIDNSVVDNVEILQAYGGYIIVTTKGRKKK